MDNMKITFAPGGVLQIDNAILMFKNFKGKAGMYNREGDRSFSVRIDDSEIADALLDAGWKVKIKEGVSEDDPPRMRLDVKVKYNEWGGPRVILRSGRNTRDLSEAEIGILDNIRIVNASLDINPNDWRMPDGRTGRTAYLKTLYVEQEVDRFARFLDDEE